MRSICLYLHVHQPFRFREYSVFDITKNDNYWDDSNFDSKQNNERIFKKVAEKSYYPMFSLIEENLKKHPGLVSPALGLTRPNFGLRI